VNVEDMKRENFQVLFDIIRENGYALDRGTEVRFAVQFNLFGGSIANLGDDAQLEWLRGVFKRGEIGAFFAY